MERTTINCNGNLIDISQPQVVGIINITSDSFYAGSRVKEQSLIEKVRQYVDEGAQFVDIGAWSSRPGAKTISEKEEEERLFPCLEMIKKHFPNLHVSVDTWRAAVAEKSITAFGADLINDISAGNMDEKMFGVIARYNLPYIMMHMQGIPETMQSHTTYQHLVQDILKFFSRKVFMLRDMGVNDIIIDPGFGFSKTITQNFQLIKQLYQFNVLELPIMVGLSRKSTIYKTLQTNPDEALNGTTVLHTLALMHGISFLRVHDVKPAIETIKMMKAYKNAVKQDD